MAQSTQKTHVMTGSPESVRVVVFNTPKPFYDGAHTETGVSPARRCDFRRRKPADNPGDMFFLTFCENQRAGRFRACCRPPNHPPDPIDGCPQKTSSVVRGAGRRLAPGGGSTFMLWHGQCMACLWSPGHGPAPPSVWSGLPTLVHRLLTIGVVADALLPAGGRW